MPGDAHLFLARVTPVGVPLTYLISTTKLGGTATAATHFKTVEADVGSGVALKPDYRLLYFYVPGLWVPGLHRSVHYHTSLHKVDRMEALQMKERMRIKQLRQSLESSLREG